LIQSFGVINMRGELVGKGGWDWMFNPIFLSLEILLIDLVLAKTFAIESPNIVGSAVLLLFGLIYKWVDFSSQTKLQVYMISVTGLLELAIVSSDFSIDRTLIQSILCVAILVVGVFHISRTRIFMMGDTIRVHGLVGKREFALAKTSVEVREPGISILLRSGELILHEDGGIYRTSGIYRPELLRRKLIDEGGAIPHFQRASWAGTLWVFLLVLAMIAFIESALFIMIYWLLPIEGVFLGVGAFFTWIIANICIFNLRIPRYPIDPAADLRNQNRIAVGMWTEIFYENEVWVTKQLFRCGWGHNDYVRHRVPIIGSKICGKWNPLALVIIHVTMLIYQMIGVKRRIIYEDFVGALPRTKLEYTASYRYGQEWVPKKFNQENVPVDIQSQMNDLQNDLSRVGLSIDDMHARNFRIDNCSKIQAIDGELYTDGEVFLKSLLVRLIDGRQVRGMEPVLGCNRVVRWVDHRPSVDDIVDIS